MLFCCQSGQFEENRIYYFNTQNLISAGQHDNTLEGKDDRVTHWQNKLNDL